MYDEYRAIHVCDARVYMDVSVYLHLYACTMRMYVSWLLSRVLGVSQSRATSPHTTRIFESIQGGTFNFDIGYNFSTQSGWEEGEG